jgi:hypothetical protein
MKRAVAWQFQPVAGCLLCKKGATYLVSAGVMILAKKLGRGISPQQLKATAQLSGRFSQKFLEVRFCQELEIAFQIGRKINTQSSMAYSGDPLGKSADSFGGSLHGMMDALFFRPKRTQG